MGLYKIGHLWPPKQAGAKSIASGYLQFPGKRVRVVVLNAKQGGGYAIMSDDGEEQQQQQGQGQAQRAPGGFSGGSQGSGGGGFGGAPQGGSGEGEPGGGWDDVPF